MCRIDGTVMETEEEEVGVTEAAMMEAGTGSVSMVTVATMMSTEAAMMTDIM